MTQRNKKVKLFSPLAIMLIGLVLLVSLLLFAFRFYPLLTLSAVLIVYLIAKFLIKREHLILFTDEYDSDFIVDGSRPAERETES